MNSISVGVFHTVTSELINCLCASWGLISTLKGKKINSRICFGLEAVDGISL